MSYSIDRQRIFSYIENFSKLKTIKIFEKGQKNNKKKATKKLQIVAFEFLLCSFYRSPKKRQNCDKSDNL